MAFPTYEQLIEAIDRHVAKGGEVRSQMWGFDLYEDVDDGDFVNRFQTVKLRSNCGCALAIYCEGKAISSSSRETRVDVLKDILDVTEREIRNFIQGFDNIYTGECSPSFMLGQRVRQHCIQKEYFFFQR